MTKTALIKKIEGSGLADNQSLIEVREASYNTLKKNYDVKVIRTLSIMTLKQILNDEDFKMSQIANYLKDIKKALEKKAPVVYYTKVKN